MYSNNPSPYPLPKGEGNTWAILYPALKHGATDINPLRGYGAG